VVSVFDTLQGLPISPSNAHSDDHFVFVYSGALFQPMAIMLHKDRNFRNVGYITGATPEANLLIALGRGIGKR
jgi:hypothetical protein